MWKSLEEVMDRVKILHCGDLHFDTPFGEGHILFKEKRKEDLKETFETIVKKARDEKVDLLLLAGDLFDNRTVMKSTLDFIRDKLREIEHIRVFISPGNHDPYNEKSFYALVNWPSNVHIFKEELERVYIPELNVAVFGVGFTYNYHRESLIRDFNEKFNSKDSTIINIMVLHGEISVGGGNEYNPITLEDIGNTNMNYIALGHRHRFSGILREKDTYYAYSGNPEGRGFDEEGDKGGILGDIYLDKVDLQFISLCKRRYIVKEVYISDIHHYSNLAECILNSIDEEERKINLYKIILKGELKEDFIINMDILHERIEKNFFYVKLEDKTTIEVDYEDLAKENSLKGVFAKKMLERISLEESELEKEKLFRALKIGLQALTDREVTID